jgi:hypothetical protein
MARRFKQLVEVTVLMAANAVSNECLAILPDTILAHAVRQIGTLCNGIGQ